MQECFLACYDRACSPRALHGGGYAVDAEQQGLLKQRLIFGLSVFRGGTVALHEFDLHQVEHVGVRVAQTN